MADKPDLQKFLSDPAFQGDRDLIFGCIDARLQHHAAEAEKRANENAAVNIFDFLFAGVRREEKKK